MLKKFIEDLIERKHYWRPGQIDELTELYWSQMLRSLSLGIISVFVPIYLYKLGLGFDSIFFYFVFWFAFRPILDIFTGFIIAKIGPKHTMMLAVFVQLVHLSMLLSLGQYDWPLWLVASTGGWSYGLFALAMEVDFSKVKHSKHGGKELGYSTIFERSGAVLGPLVGGIVAGVFGPQYTIMLAIVVLVASLIPLFLSNEPTRINQEIKFEDFPWKKYKRDVFSVSAFILENNIVTVIWPLFVGVFIFTANSYELLGVATAIGTVGGILSAVIIGRLTDEHRGRQMLRVSTVLNAALHLTRPFVGGFGQVTAVNAINDPLTTGYKIPIFKGLYDRADSVPGFRIVYLCALSAFTTAARLVFWLILWVLVHFVDPLMLLKLALFSGAIFSLAINFENFPGIGAKNAKK